MTTINQLSLIDLSCEHGDLTLFSQCDFTITSGQWVQIAGKNGSGKTSLIRILTGIASPKTGKVLWNGIPIIQNRENYHADLFYIGHQTGIKPELSAWENLQFFIRLQSLSVSDEQLRYALNQLALIGWEDLPCYQLSAGQQRRVALTKLWLTHAAIWILDEPFTAIDQIGIEHLTARMAQHCHNGGIVIFSSHQAINSNQITTLSLDQFIPLNK